jgi:hypothetical protein
MNNGRFDIFLSSPWLRHFLKPRLFSQKKRNDRASKIQAEFEKKMARYESYIDKLERRAGHVLHTKGTPTHPL